VLQDTDAYKSGRGWPRSVRGPYAGLPPFQNRTPDDDVLIDATGLLHTMWLSRNHPELETLMDHVDHPTDKNLREAGMVQTRLVGGNLRKRRSCGSF
jgi:hypothetical protein